MTDQEKKKLLIALSGYYPHGVIVEIEGYGIHKLKGIDIPESAAECRSILSPLD